MNKTEFIMKWNVAYESKEQEAEFAAEMFNDLESLSTQSRPEPSVGYSEEDMKRCWDASRKVEHGHIKFDDFVDYIATLTKQGSEEEGRGV